jgi:NaMN:DMB phosphoribosyltransferase
MLLSSAFIGHATFLIESPAGVTIATDYNGVVKPSVVPAHRHHEPGAFDPFHALSRAGDRVHVLTAGARTASRRGTN